MCSFVFYVFGCHDFGDMGAMRLFFRFCNVFLCGVGLDWFKMSQEHEEEHSTQTELTKPRRTNPPRFNPDDDGKRRATLMRRVHQVRTKGERIEVLFGAKGQPLRKEGDALQSWI